MKDFLLGHHHGTGKPFRLPVSSFHTHWHLIGGTGKGKTTAIHAMLHPLLLDPVRPPCVIIIDRMGNLSAELLLWMASDFCTDDVRDRLVYIEPARENVILPYNPLLYDTLGHGYYKVSRAMEIILRGWASQDLEQMPRLARWMFNSFWAAAQLGLTIADCEHLLLPGSPHHRPLLRALPPRLQVEWSELIQARSAEVVRILESTRNRLKPFFESVILRNMFGATRNHLDVLRFMREGKIVLLNLGPYNRVPEQIADAVGGLVIHEVLSTARSLPLGVRYPTFLFLDEFQRFVGPDIEAAIPEVRQLGIKLVLSHQSLAQLERGDVDLTALIFQCQSRMIFGVQGEDADLLAHELASLTFNPKRIKDELYSRRQLLSGHKIIELQSEAFSTQEADNWSRGYSHDWSAHTNLVQSPSGPPVKGEGSSSGKGDSDSRGGSASSGRTLTTHQQLVPVHDEFLELSSRTYYTFEESKNEWARDVRKLQRGQAFLRLVDDPRLLHIDVKRDAPGHLAWDMERLLDFFPEAITQMHELVERNFQSDWFVTPDVIERETQERLTRVLSPAITLQAPAPASQGGDQQVPPPSDKSPLL